MSKVKLLRTFLQIMKDGVYLSICKISKITLKKLEIYLVGDSSKFTILATWYINRLLPDFKIPSLRIILII